MPLVLSHVSVSYPARRPGAAGAFGLKYRRTVVEDVSLSLDTGETLGLVGESGCGKTTLARAVVGLVPVDSGSIALDGRLLAGAPAPNTSAPARPKSFSVAGRRAVQMVFQDPFSSLNPRRTVLDLLTEAAVAHKLVAPRDRVPFAERLLADVGLPAGILNRFPHAFSGGQRQRLNIARALSLEPEVLVCDEPVSALDVSVQAQVLNLLQDLRDSRGLSMLFISHDIAVVQHISQRVAVMQDGRIVEEGPTEELLARPRHPFTRSLLAAAL